MVAHGAIALLFAFLAKGRAQATSGASTTQELVFIEQEERALPAPNEPAPAPSEPAGASPLAAARLLPARPSVRNDAPMDQVAPVAEAVVTAPVGSSDNWTFSTKPSVDLGVGGYWKSVALAGSAAPNAPLASASAPEPAPNRPDRRLLETLNARDMALGLSRGGPLVAAAHEAASLAIAPDTGSATFDVDADESGRVMAANIVSTNGNAPAWSEVARELVNLMASKRLRPRPGTHGLRTRLRIVAARTLPSGEQVASSPGAVPDDVAGGDRACEGEGWDRKCLAGSPAGVTRSIGDVANIGARPTRIVHAQILNEGAL
jgi:hypothetical protein